MSCRKRLSSDANSDANSDNVLEYIHKKKRQMIYKSASSHTTTKTGAEGQSKQIELPMYTQAEVTVLLHNQEQLFRAILEEKLREQFNMFNQMYIDNIFKEYKNADLSYIN